MLTLVDAQPLKRALSNTAIHYRKRADEGISGSKREPDRHIQVGAHSVTKLLRRMYLVALLRRPFCFAFPRGEPAVSMPAKAAVAEIKNAPSIYGDESTFGACSHSVT